MANNHFLIKISDGKRGINLNLVTDWRITSDRALFVNFGEHGRSIAGKMGE